ncbi:unnamed protein product [Paramecium sonneborni]|uniref:Uncharacterized protein n=1 Tax=Paramecium sonneborni TaxID=65129 RepID=A0A8S1NBY1_9CILI|nr:unnamed protein product [Paramecium sonneborni]
MHKISFVLCCQINTNREIMGYLMMRVRYWGKENEGSSRKQLHRAFISFMRDLICILANAVMESIWKWPRRCSLLQD